MKARTLFAFLFVCLMLFSACTSPSNDGGGSSGSAGSEAQVASAGTSSGIAGAGDPILKDGTVSELRMVFPGQSSSPASLSEVEDAMNAIVRDTVDAEVKMEIVEWGVYTDQTNLMLSSGEEVSLMFNFSDIRNLAKTGKIQPLSGLLDSYGKDALAEFDKYLDACRIDGELYGLPSFFDYAAYAGLVCRTDILEELNIDAESIRDWDDIEQVLIKVQEAHPTMNPLTLPEYAGALPYYTHGKFDEVLSGSGVRVYADETENIEVVNYYATPEYRALAEKAYEWKQKGYFIPDATTATNSRQEYISSGNTFGYIGKIHPGTVTQETKNSGYAMTTIPVTDAVLSTNNVNFAQYTVPVGCKTPEKAVAFLNIFYSDPAMQNLMAYGIEDQDYIMKDEGKQIVGYPEGIDETNVGWLNETWVCGNGKISHVWETDSPTIWEDYAALNDSAAVSPIYGFDYDISGVKNEIAAVQNVIDKNDAVIGCGYAEVDESLAAFQTELEAAGIQKIIDDAQAQIDQWLESR